ncbi:hypothetical protein B0I21_101552 [Sphingobacterium paludis]|uniref:Uncharacterized protein n=1 Tax=Sphingobacterium paludis TaxID=1476465 RepID=A0A4R7DBM8_9SPHI|nr:hypothetical protein B0I21_101552 [Sphingobacterium paludis]
MLRHEEITTVNATYRHKEEGRTSTNGPSLVKRFLQTTRA